MINKIYKNVRSGEILDLDKVATLNDKSMLKASSKLWEQWDFEKNIDLDIYKYSYGSGQEAWWFCDENHEIKATINSRKNNKGCVYCLNQKALKGYNDMWTTNPELAELLADPEDGYKYMQSSGKRVDWKCKDCNVIIENQIINNICRKGVKCSICSYSKSIGEKMVYYLLTKSGLEFQHDKAYTWSNRKRYDFYIPSINTIIETHGGQHYKFTGRGRSLEEEIHNDNMKYNLAKINGIDDYLILDCRESDFEFVKNSILNSKLIDILELEEVIWEEVYLACNTTTLKLICENYNDGLITNKELCEKLKLSKSAVNRNLKLASKLGWIDYTPDAKSAPIKIIMCNDKDEVIKEFRTMSETKLHLRMAVKSIHEYCRGERNSEEFKLKYDEFN